MESMKIAWMYRYLLEIAKNRAQNYVIVYVDETWYDSHDTVKKIWTDSSVSNLFAPVSKGKRFAIFMLVVRKVLQIMPFFSVERTYQNIT